jgi:DNA-binding response OmpR family regulator
VSLRRVVLIDADRGLCESVRALLSEDGLACELAEGAEHAQKLCEEPEVGALLLGLSAARPGGLELLSALRERRPALRVIALGDTSAQQLILEALRRGASDYLARPIHPEELRLAVRRALEATETASRFAALCARLEGLADDLAGLGARGHTEPEAVAEALADAAARQLGAARSSVLLFDGGEHLRVAAIRGGDLAAAELSPVPIADSVAGLAFAADEALRIDDVDRDERCAGRARRGRYAQRSALLVPLRAASGPLGVLCATERPAAQPFAPEDLALARVLALAAAPRLAPPEAPSPPPEPVVRIEKDPEEALQVELASGVADALCAEIEPGPLLSAALARVAALLGAAPVSLYLVDARAGALALEASGADARADRARLPRERGLAGEVLRSGRCVAAARPEALPHYEADVDTPEDGGAGALYCVPIAIRGRVLGLARAFLPAGESPSLRTAELLASSLSAAVRNALLYRSLLESIDDLARARREAGGRK